VEHDKSDLRIGELLIEAQILRARELSDAIKITKITNLPIGRVLVMSSFVSEKSFQAAVKAQSMVRDSVLPLRTAIQALSQMSRKEQTFEEALNDLGWAAAADAQTNKLGELLLECGIITQEHFDRAMQTSQDTSLPLGRVLVALGTTSDETLSIALNTQVLIRDKKITREQGVAGLKSAYQRRQPLELTLMEKGFFRGPNKPSIRLGELFVLAGLLDSVAVMSSLEIALTSGKPLGETLIEQNLISSYTLDVALALQEMVANRTLDHNQAAQSLYKIHSGATMNDVLTRIEVPEADFKVTVRFHDVLRVAGILQHSDIELTDIEPGRKPSTPDALDAAAKLMQNGFIDQRTYYGALRCYFLMATGWLSIQQGIIALNYFAHQQHLTFDDVLLELDWTVQTHSRRSSLEKN
jgi:protein-disulfide isomerase-like protein with CxxC motif